MPEIHVDDTIASLLYAATITTKASKNISEKRFGMSQLYVIRFGSP